MKDLSVFINLVENFKKFPSIGSKTAERIAYNLIDMDMDDIEKLIQSIKKVKENIKPCSICGLLSDSDICHICKNQNRNHKICIVLENHKDIDNFEKLSNYNGTFHILNGAISSIHGITPDKLRIKELINRIKTENIQELIIATSPTIEGETTALYIARLLKDSDVKITRIGYGIPAGAKLEYIDELTISKAIDNRTNIK
ncbi:MAG: recombination mediator RecR [Bacillales bacterium]